MYFSHSCLDLWLSCEWEGIGKGVPCAARGSRVSKLAYEQERDGRTLLDRLYQDLSQDGFGNDHVPDARF